MVYEDNDCEDLTSAEVRACLVAANSVSSETKALLWGHAEALLPKRSKKNTTEGNKKAKKQTTSTSTSSHKKKKTKTTVSPPYVTNTPPTANDASADNSANKGSKGKHSVLAASEGPLVLQEPVDTYDNYVSKTFFGFGVFYGLLVSCQLPFYKVRCGGGEGMCV